MRQYVDLRLEYFRKFLNLGMLSIQSFFEMKPVLGDLFEDFARRELQILKEILETAKRNGEFSLEDPDKVAEVLLHLLQGLRLRTLRSAPGPQLSDESYEQLREETRLAADIFLHGILT